MNYEQYEIPRFMFIYPFLLKVFHMNLYVNFLYLFSLYTSYNCLGSYSALNFMVNDSNPLGDPTFLCFNFIIILYLYNIE